MSTGDKGHTRHDDGRSMVEKRHEEVGCHKGNQQGTMEYGEGIGLDTNLTRTTTDVDEGSGRPRNLEMVLTEYIHGKN